MARTRFKGSVGRRFKNSPLLVEHLDRALGETRSDLEKDIVYANLTTASREASSEDYFQEFYLRLAREEAPLSVPSNYRGTPDEKKVKTGRDLADQLREAVILPRIGHPRYESKMLQAKHDEYSFLLEKNNREGDREK